MLPLKELLDKCLIEISTPDELDMTKVQPLLEEFNFAVVRGVVSEKAVEEAKKKIFDDFDHTRDRPATGEHPEELHSHFQKLSIGGAEQSGTYRPRCMRTLYTPVWSDDRYGMRDMFVSMAQIRNLIYGFKKDFAITEIEDQFWTAARMHHYPAGAGFLVSHLDNVVPVVQAAEGINGYFQPILSMSRKGKGTGYDFETGGGFFELGETRYYFEEECLLGDIVIYSGATRHGVADIDIHKPFRQNETAGRWCAFCTLYRHFTQKGELDKYVKPGDIKE